MLTEEKWLAQSRQRDSFSVRTWQPSPSTAQEKERQSLRCWWPHLLGTFQGHHVRLWEQHHPSSGATWRNILQLYLNGPRPTAHVLITIWLPMLSWQQGESKPMDHVCLHWRITAINKRILNSSLWFGLLGDDHTMRPIKSSARCAHST